MKLPLLVILCGSLTACGSSTPTPADQIAVGTYSAALAACIATAKASDAGLAGYEACAAKVDAAWHRTTADGGS
jgi:hypothetical protein